MQRLLNKSILCLLLLFIETLAYCQGFNARYDAFDWENAQTGFGIERTINGWAIISGSHDVDSLAPDFFLSHVSVLFTFIDQEGNKIDERRTYRPMHGTFPGWANCCDTTADGGFVAGGSSEATDGSDEIYLMRFDASGDTIWTRVFGDPLLNDFWIGSQVKTTRMGGF